MADAADTVIVKGGPGPRDFASRELRDGESAGLGYVDSVYIADAVRALGRSAPA